MSTGSSIRRWCEPVKRFSTSLLYVLVWTERPRAAVTKTCTFDKVCVSTYNNLDFIFMLTNMTQPMFGIYEQYGKPSRNSGWSIDYLVSDATGNLVPFGTHFADATALILEANATQKAADRKEMWYLAYLDNHSDKYIQLFSQWGTNKRLPKDQTKILDAIIHIYIAKDLAKRIDFWTRRTQGNGGNPEFFEHLRSALDTLTFEGVNQADLAHLFKTTQSELSQPFKALCTKWILVEAWTSRKKKLFKVADLDLIGFYVMRYL